MSGTFRHMFVKKDNKEEKEQDSSSSSSSSSSSVPPPPDRRRSQSISSIRRRSSSNARNMEQDVLQTASSPERAKSIDGLITNASLSASAPANASSNLNTVSPIDPSKFSSVSRSLLERMVLQSAKLRTVTSPRVAVLEEAESEDSTEQLSLVGLVRAGLANAAIGWHLLLVHRVFCSTEKLCEMLERENATKPTQVLALVAVWVARLTHNRDMRAPLLRLLNAMSGTGASTSGCKVIRAFALFVCLIFSRLFQRLLLLVS